MATFQSDHQSGRFDAVSEFVPQC